ncbi:hypothetical protein J1N35_044116 [Gossypium stocksii]|uniref:Uncharacterized protein n=1 Tax=Gossypium stocksii TaxID=47602 RepID=A0A9D3ZFU2_9ROSI|nr:hypothetical protein J1N35_044116 [Gossypium stocksii]
MVYKAALGNRMLASGSKQKKLDVPNPKKFKGPRSAREVDNFLWEMEQYFYAMSIEDNAIKVNIALIYLLISLFYGDIIGPQIRNVVGLHLELGMSFKNRMLDCPEQSKISVIKKEKEADPKEDWILKVDQ